MKNREEKQGHPKALYQSLRRHHWENVHALSRRPNLFSGAYHKHLQSLFSRTVAPQSRVLEVGCGNGDLLAALTPCLGIGIDHAGAAIRLAQEKHGRNPRLHFSCGEADQLPLRPGPAFDAIICSDLLNDLWDVQGLFQHLLDFSSPSTRLYLNFHSHLWSLPLRLAQTAGLANPLLAQNWLTVDDVGHLLKLGGWEPIDHQTEVLLPFPERPCGRLINSFLAHLPFFSAGALTHVMVARPSPGEFPHLKETSVSVIIPVRNEAGHLSDLFARLAPVSPQTEFLFVEGHSTDNSWDCLQGEIARNTHLECRSFRQPGKGKRDAVQTGFQEARGDILIILDSDLSVAPEDLHRFYRALVSGTGEFINGVRLVYPMEDQAMQFANLVGNKLFSWALSWTLGQPVKDCLCGTKAFWRRDLERLGHFGPAAATHDPFGDFDLLIGAAQLKLKIVDLPVRYHARTYGETNIQRWQDGWKLLKRIFAAARQLHGF